MSNTYTKIHIQFVFAVKYRDAVIQSSWKIELYRYITGIVQKNKHKLLVINGMSDHIHLLVGLRTTQSISDLLQDVKGSSSRWINEGKFVKGKFEWQEGYGAFSYASDELDNVIDYIKNQEIHHRRISFKNEYIQLLEEYNIEYDDKYTFRELI